MPAGVGPRVSKEEFLRALGLDARNPQHEQYYRAMRDEAIIVYNRMNQNTSDLLDSVRNDPSTHPPFFWHHVRPERQRWGIMEIWRNAGPLTRPLFDRGATEGEHGPNWVAGWLLYSVFRSRDVRNNRNRRKGESTGTGGAAAAANGGTDLSRRSRFSGGQSGEQQSSVRIGFYDPVRNG